MAGEQYALELFPAFSWPRPRGGLALSVWVRKRNINLLSGTHHNNINYANIAVRYGNIYNDTILFRPNCQLINNLLYDLQLAISFETHEA